MQQVHQEQLLMLLFVVETQLEQVALQPFQRDRGVGQAHLHPSVDLGAIGHDLSQRRARHQTSLIAADAFAERLIVGVEDLLQTRIERLIARPVQQHGFEEPAHMAQVPLARTGFGHRLRLQVFGGQGCRQVGHHRAHAAIALQIPGDARRSALRSGHDPACPWVSVRCGHPVEMQPETRRFRVIETRLRALSLSCFRGTVTIRGRSDSIKSP